MRYAVTIDLDTANQFIFLKTYFNLKYYFGDVKTYVSPSGKGYHLIAPCNLPIDKILEFRAMFGDDEVRVKLDENYRKNSVFFGTIFTKKKGKREIEVNPLSLPFKIWKTRRRFDNGRFRSNKLSYRCNKRRSRKLEEHG